MKAFGTGHLKTGSLDLRRVQDVVCDQCGLTGTGSPLAKRHDGACKKEYQRKLQIRLAKERLSR